MALRQAQGERINSLSERHSTLVEQIAQPTEEAAAASTTTEKIIIVVIVIVAAVVAIAVALVAVIAIAVAVVGKTVALKVIVLLLDQLLKLSAVQPNAFAPRAHVHKDASALVLH
jgi:hypothetical protein